MSAATEAASVPAWTIRQSHLRWLEDWCPAGAHALIVEGREGPHGAGAERGTAIHEVFARYADYLATTAWHAGRRTDWPAAARITNEVLRDHPRLRFGEAQDVLGQTQTMAEGLLIDPETYYGVEVSLATELQIEGGRRVRITGRLDLLETEGAWARITDLKSNHSIPPDSAVQDDSQLRLYALLVFATLPQIEVVEGRLWLTRYGRYVPQRGTAEWTRPQADELREHLHGRIAALLDGRLRDAYVPGAHCQYCPRRRPGDCACWRAYRGTAPPPARTYYQARRLARRLTALEQEREVLLERLKAYVDEHGPLRVGDTERAEVWGYHASESEEYDAAEVWDLLSRPEVQGIIGDSRGRIGELFRVDQRGKAWRSLRYHRDLRTLFDDIARPRVSTRFGHKEER